jgi:hypothetical protein
MTDASPEFPPGWPTDDHRSRVAARARALRNRRLARRSTALALAAVVLAGGFALLHGRSSSDVRVATASSTTTTTSRPPARPETRTVAEPTGWRIVDYGDARVAAPPDWTVALLPRFTTDCPPDAPTGVVIYQESQATCSSVVIGPIYPGPFPPRPALTIHGIKLYLSADDVTFVSYSAPELGVSLSVRRTGAARSVLGTLTSSARRVVLGPGDAPSVPSDWRTVAFGGVSLRVPPTMPVTHLGPNNLQPGACARQAFPKPAVALGNGYTGLVRCLVSPGVAIPTDGVWISAPHPQLPHSYATSLVVAGLRLWVDTSTDPVLTIQPQRGDTELPALVHIGLGPDPSVARTILYSICASDRPG